MLYFSLKFLLFIKVLKVMVIVILGIFSFIPCQVLAGHGHAKKHVPEILEKYRDKLPRHLRGLI